MSQPRSATSKLQDLPLSRTETFPGRYDSLAEIARFVRQSAADAGLNDFSTYMVETAVDEACSNIIEHAYGGEGNGDIEITCKNEPVNLTIVIRDWGKSFDPETVGDPDMQTSLEDLPGHGLGLFFMRKWMDEVKFDFGQQGNVLTMIKHKESAA
jgi:serine/threonine-protein kinase RsbW